MDEVRAHACDARSEQEKRGWACELTYIHLNDVDSLVGQGFGIGTPRLHGYDIYVPSQTMESDSQLDYLKF